MTGSLSAQQLQPSNHRLLARAISLIENEVEGYQQLLQSLVITNPPPLIGLTGPPGAGKSTLANALVHHYLQQNLHIAILAIDPSSPFNYGALLGDRIRLNQHYNNPKVFIRSLASRGALGGLSTKIIEISDLLKAAQFDIIFIETVGVGQSEVEIAGLADSTVVIFVPEAGDEIQTMKAGIMEVADIFVVNKADHDYAATFAQNLRKLAHNNATHQWETPVIKTIATQQSGIQQLADALQKHHDSQVDNPKKVHLLVQKSLQLIQKQRMKDVNVKQLHQQIQAQMTHNKSFNLYAFLKKEGYY